MYDFWLLSKASVEWYILKHNLSDTSQHTSSSLNMF